MNYYHATECLKLSETNSPNLLDRLRVRARACRERSVGQEDREVIAPDVFAFCDLAAELRDCLILTMPSVATDLVFDVVPGGKLFGGTAMLRMSGATPSHRPSMFPAPDWSLTDMEYIVFGHQAHLSWGRWLEDGRVVLSYEAKGWEILKGWRRMVASSGSLGTAQAWAAIPEYEVTCWVDQEQAETFSPRDPDGFARLQRFLTQPAPKQVEEDEGPVLELSCDLSRQGGTEDLLNSVAFLVAVLSSFDLAGGSMSSADMFDAMQEYTRSKSEGARGAGAV